MKELGKWPQLRVSGTPVTESQAQEIIIKTSLGGWFPQTNDKEFINRWDAHVETLYKPTGNVWDDTENRGNAIREKYGVIELNYLHNEQIVSSYIGGPHGWINWDGTIGENQYYNVGKWPSVEELQKDLDAIASAFPFLDMRVQLFADNSPFSDEECFIDATVEFVLKNGTAKLLDTPGDNIHYKKTINPVESFISNLSNGQKHGIHADQFFKVLENLANKE